MYKARIKKIIDGDTIDMYVNLGLGFFANARIRLRGVHAPEIFKVKKESAEFKAGQIAKLHVKKWFFPEDNYYFLKAEHRGLYGRWIGEVYKVDKTESLNEHLKLIFGKSPYWDWFHQEPLTEDWK